MIKDIKLDNINFLINSFNESVNQYGKDVKTIACYKQQVHNAVKHGNVNNKEFTLVKKLLGIQNTNNIKWTIAEKSIEMFNIALNKVLNYDSDLAIYLTLYSMLKNNIITNKVYNILIDLYNIDTSKEVNMNDLIKLATVPEFTDYALYKLYITKDKYNESLNTYEAFIEACKNYEINLRPDIPNPNHENGYIVKISNINKNKNLLWYLATIGSVEVGKLKYTGTERDIHDNECKVYKFIENQAGTRILRSIDWRVVYIDTVKKKFYNT